MGKPHTHSTVVDSVGESFIEAEVIEPEQDEAEIIELKIVKTPVMSFLSNQHQLATEARLNVLKRWVIRTLKDGLGDLAAVRPSSAGAQGRKAVRDLRKVAGNPVGRLVLWWLGITPPAEDSSENAAARDACRAFASNAVAERIAQLKEVEL